MTKVGKQLDPLMEHITNISKVKITTFDIIYSSEDRREKDVLSIRKDMNNSDNVLLIGKTSDGTIIGGYISLVNEGV